MSWVFVKRCVLGEGLQLTLVTMPGDGYCSGEPRRSRESPRIMGQKHKLRSEGHTWDLQEATTDPRMEGRREQSVNSV